MGIAPARSVHWILLSAARRKLFIALQDKSTSLMRLASQPSPSRTDHAAPMARDLG
jgi:hypothetical protein